MSPSPSGNPSREFPPTQLQLQQPGRSVLRAWMQRSRQALAAMLKAARPVLLVSLITSSSVVLVRQAGGLQAWELRAYDLMMRLRPHPGPDERLLIITITEADIQKAKRWPISDALFAQALANLQQHQPRVIGLDIYRDFPHPPGTNLLHNQLQYPNVIGIRLLPTDANPNGVAPPDMPADQIGFNDVILDPDGILRRNLLLTWDDETGNVEYSFAYRLAERYLRGIGINPVPKRDQDDVFDWGKATIRPFFHSDGGYQTVQHDGWQVMFNYRSARDFARTVTLYDLLEGKIRPEWVKGKIVLVGSTALSDKDFFLTPFARSEKGSLDMAGVLIHAQAVSQLLDAVLGHDDTKAIRPLIRPLIQVWPEAAELLLIVACTILGVALTGLVRNPLMLVLLELGAIALLLLATGALFLGSTWLPIVAPVVGLVSGSIAMISHNSYRTQRDQRILAARAEEQEQAILALRLAVSRQLSPAAIAPSPSSPMDLANPATFDTQTGSPILPRPNPQRSSFQRDGMVANRYQIKQVLAAGGFGITYVATDTQRPGAPECVVKRLRPGRQDDQFVGVARRLFQAEAEILEILGRHDRIPQLLAYFEEGADFLLVEQFIQGHPLSQELPQDQRWPQAKVVALLRELLPTLGFIHERRIIHRDIKPNNIMRRLDGALVLIDFGAVKQMRPQNEAVAEQTISIGTQGYAPPEQLAGHPRVSSDIYALGVIAIRALTGIPPHMMEQDPDRGDLVWQPFVQKHVQPELQQILARMTRYHFGDRYTSAEQVLSDLALLKLP
ncbi:MAG: CHASE2 domain-containing protein [Synechococcales cyanobacterium RU_4_20]|nr:CHASE2 domain-containing protein [Synechococcales cyanobacterium RU_4_20]